jgi:biotin carboxylase
MKTKLIVVGSGQREYREYCLKDLSQAYDLLLVTGKEPTWERPYIVDFERANQSRSDEVVRAARELARRHQVAGVFTYDEFSVEPAGDAALALGVVGNPPEVCRACRDKARMRAAWAAAGVPSPVSYPVTSVQEARAAARRVGYPVVVKPTRVALSVGVKYVRDETQLEQAFADAAFGASLFDQPQGCLVEEYLEGDEVSVESLVRGGDVRVVTVTRKQVGFFPFFEEVGHAVSPHEPLPAQDAIEDVVRRAHQALGIQVGVTHAEVKLTPGGPKMVELGLRLAGDFIPKLVQLTCAVDLCLEGARIATGEAGPAFPGSRHACGGCDTVLLPSARHRGQRALL